ncbi:hypothetical protein TrRE_jg6302 [Triparma retinervis]|uniref:Mitochondrial carrier protein n=1 Tax=Triparma retinervis TaxID=2557542 RepID=A0A9W6ZHS4_9STRA|nr:hypothetical protein TrRE_jg6302 [Triparma retinervis]
MLSQTGEGGGRSALALTRHVIKTEGVSGMFAGNATNLLRIFPSKGVVFASSDYYRKMLRFLAGVPEGTQAPGAVSFVAGGCAGVTATALTYPLDFVRGRIAGKGVAPGEEKKYSSTMQTIRVTIKEEGAGALFKGIRPTLIGSFPYLGIQFGTVGLLESLFPKEGDATNVYRKVMFGATGGVAAGCLTYPNDTVRRMLQLQGTPGYRNYGGYFECARTVLREEGIWRFYRGMGVNLVRMAPNTAVQFGAYELLKETLIKR